MLGGHQATRDRAALELLKHMIRRAIHNGESIGLDELNNVLFVAEGIVIDPRKNEPVRLK